MNVHRLALWAAALLVSSTVLSAAAKNPGSAAEVSLSTAPPAPRRNRPPTLANIPYGSHPRQVLDFWKVESARPTPLLFFIHGGGWVTSDKQDVNGYGSLARFLEAGISVVSINYRYTSLAHQAEVMPPVQWPLQDAARALQFVRSKAAEWNFDKTRVGTWGPSAGGCSSLWLALHDDMANPTSADLIARESTRLLCAAGHIAQTTLDPQQMKAWTPNSRYGGHAFGFTPDPTDRSKRDSQFPQFLAAREKILPWIREYSPYEWASSDDPPIYLSYRTAPALGQDDKDPTHTANFGVKLIERLREVGVKCEMTYPGASDVIHPSGVEFLIAHLNR